MKLLCLKVKRIVNYEINNGNSMMKNKIIDSLISGSDIIIKEAWHLINKNKRHVLFIVNKKRNILGSVADGDVRRWILADKSINESVVKVMNKQPVIAKRTDSLNTIKQLMLNRKIECIPIVDENNMFVDIFFLSGMMEDNCKVRQMQKKMNLPVVIMAGGIGTRLAPFTKVLPKPLIPINEKPIIEIIIERFLEYSISDFYISIYYKANMIKAYFKDNLMPCKLHFLEESKPIGTGGALYMLKNKIDSTFFVTNCDILINADYSQLLDFHKKNENKMTLVCAMKEFKIPYGVVKINSDGALKQMDEKPKADYLINTGMYIIDSEVLELVPDNELFHITELVENVKKSGCKIGIYPIVDEAWIDIGRIEEYRAVLNKTKYFE